MKILMFLGGVVPVVAGATDAANVVQVHTLKAAPVIDGDATDWMGVAPLTVALRKTMPSATTATPHVTIRAGVYGSRVYLLLQWPDTTESRLHKPWVWNAERKRYVSGPQREDRLALQFRMSGDYDTNWLSGRSFTADMWHWKASRTDPLGLAHDKITRISTDELPGAVRIPIHDGRMVYIQRSSDKGSKLYKTKRYGARQKDLMPKYIIEQAPSGSVADIQARGVWTNGQWALELSRLLDSGNDDDVVLTRGDSIPAGLAVFDQSGDEDHAISSVLFFKF